MQVKDTTLEHIIDWHTSRGYNIELTFKPVRNSVHDRVAWDVEWHNDARRMEYFLESKCEV